MKEIIDLAVATGAGILSAIAMLLLRYVGHLADFVPRCLHSVSIGTSAESFYARGPGDNYDNVLWIQIRNDGGLPLYIVRAVYFQDKRGRIPVYINARRSTKYQKGYEIKFGEQWKSLDWLIPSRGNCETYIPLSKLIDTENIIPQGERGIALLEYVYDGKSGIHKVKL